MRGEVKRIEWEGNKFEKFMGVDFFSLVLFLSLSVSHINLFLSFLTLSFVYTRVNTYNE